MSQMQETLPMEICLTFANTAPWHASSKPEETLHSYADLLGWAGKHGLFPAEYLEALSSYAEVYGGEAEAVLQRAIELREAIYRVIVATIDQEQPASSDLQQINSELAIALSQARIIAGDPGYSWGWAQQPERLDAPLWPVVRATADLLTAPELLARVGQCADDRGCGWLFIDTSKNHSRRWCDINDCGNRAKQQRHYQRIRKAKVVDKVTN